MSEEEIKKAVNDAEKYAAEDKKHKEEIEVVNQCGQPDLSDREDHEGYGRQARCRRIRRSWKANSRSFKKVRESNDATQIKSAMESFSQATYDVFGKVYQQQQAQQGGENPQGRRARQRRRHGRERIHRQQVIPNSEANAHPPFQAGGRNPVKKAKSGGCNPGRRVSAESRKASEYNPGRRASAESRKASGYNPGRCVSAESRKASEYNPGRRASAESRKKADAIPDGAYPTKTNNKKVSKLSRFPTQFAARWAESEELCDA